MAAPDSDGLADDGAFALRWPGRAEPRSGAMEVVEPNDHIDDRAGVLLVSEDRATVARWTEWLEAAGFAVASCPGPHLAWPCGRLTGERCALRELADVAVVDLPDDGATELYSDSGDRICTTLPDDGTNVFVPAPSLRMDLPPRTVRLRHPVTEPWLVGAVREAGSRRRRLW